MKILYLANAKSIHTEKWGVYFANKGNAVGVISFEKKTIPNLDNFYLGYDGLCRKSSIEKIELIRAIKKIRKIIVDFKPDILHAHYASSYGLAGTLCGFHPYVLSVWGSDIFDFPRKSIFHKKLIEFNLSRADYICSTSIAMAEETKKYTRKEIEITPFGVDCDKFSPKPKDGRRKEIVVGTVKSLEDVYGIDYLINAFQILVKKYPKLPLNLQIAGSGSRRKYLEKLSEKLGIKEKTIFLGQVENKDVPKVLNNFTVAVNSSIRESFGVSVLEASACGVPVVVSNTGGLPEVVKNGVTGFLVAPCDSLSIAAAIEKIILNKNLQEEMGSSGRKFVLEKYNWEKTSKIMESLYKKIIKK